MVQTLGYVVVSDYDEAIAFFTHALGFTLFEDTDLGQGKRWVLVGPPNSRGTSLLLARGYSGTNQPHRKSNRRTSLSLSAQR